MSHFNKACFCTCGLDAKNFEVDERTAGSFSDNFLIEYLIFAYSVVLMALSAYDLHYTMTSTSSQV